MGDIFILRRALGNRRQGRPEKRLINGKATACGIFPLFLGWQAQIGPRVANPRQRVGCVLHQPQRIGFGKPLVIQPRLANRWHKGAAARFLFRAGIAMTTSHCACASSYLAM